MNPFKRKPKGNQYNFYGELITVDDFVFSAQLYARLATGLMLGFLVGLVLVV